MMNVGGEPAHETRPRQRNLETRDNDPEDARWATWMVAARDGDGVSYERLLAELTRHLLPYLRRMVGPSDLCEECLQDSLLAIHTARHSYDPERPFKPWVHAVARFKAVDAIRRASTRRRYEEPKDDQDSWSDTVSPPSDLPIDTERALARLEPAYRDAVVLRLHGYTLEEAAKKAGVSRGAMRSRVHRGLRQLRTRLEDDAPHARGRTAFTGLPNFH